MENFNKFFSFLFINSKINSLLFWIRVDTGLDYMSDLESELVNNATIAKSIYKKQIRRYLGVGFVLSFIPGTEPFKARENLLANIERLESEEVLIPWFMKTPIHILARHTIGPIHQHFEEDFITIIRGNNEYFGGLNRLNPLLYPVHLFILFVRFLDHNLDFSEWELGYLHPLLKLPIVTILFIIYSIFCLVSGAFCLVYLITELILNTLNTLIVEPFQFAYEVIHQLISTWGLEYASMPTDDYNKVNQILNAIDNTLMYDALKTNSLKVYQTPELTLIESSKDLIDSMQKHRNSFFFQLNKETGLLQKDDKTIENSYNQLLNLQQFFYFTHKEMPHEFPIELKQQISAISFKLGYPARQVNKFELNSIQAELYNKDSQEEAFNGYNFVI